MFEIHQAALQEKGKSPIRGSIEISAILVVRRYSMRNQLKSQLTFGPELRHGLGEIVHEEHFDEVQLKKLRTKDPYFFWMEEAERAGLVDVGEIFKTVKVFQPRPPYRQCGRIEDTPPDCPPVDRGGRRTTLTRRWSRDGELAHQRHQ